MDYIIVNSMFCVTDVAVIPEFYVGSDHRFLRERFYFSQKREKALDSKRLLKSTIN